LTDRGIDVAQSLFTDVAEEDVDTEGGVVVTPDKKVLRFDYCFHGVDMRSGRLRLEDWTDSYGESYARRQVSIAMRMIEQDTDRHAAQPASPP